MPIELKVQDSQAVELSVMGADGAELAVEQGVPIEKIKLQDKTVAPTETEQTITADEGYDGLGEVEVGAISSTYVGSEIPRNVASAVTFEGNIAHVPTGYYPFNGSTRVPIGSATAPETISGTSATVSTGTNTLTLSKTVSVTPTVEAGYVGSGTAGNSTVSLTASVTTQGGSVYYTSSSDRSVSANRYLTGALTIKGVTTTNLVASNIKSGVTVSVGDSANSSRIKSVLGTYEGESGLVDTKTAPGSPLYPYAIGFSGLKGTPKMFAVRLGADVSSATGTTYYYIVDVVYDGTKTYGNCFQVGDSPQVRNVTGGYSWSMNGTTLTVRSSGSAQSFPGAFLTNATYELTYVY